LSLKNELSVFFLIKIIHNVTILKIGANIYVEITKAITLLAFNNKELEK